MAVFHTSLRTALLLSVTTLAFVGCTPQVEQTVFRQDVVRRVAMPVFMLNREVQAGNFVLQARERVYQKGQPATVYIEGDSLVGMKAGTTLTPDDPIALRLAAQDKGANVIWLARPCQYQKTNKAEAACPAKFAGDSRYSTEVVDGFSAALDNIKAYYNIPSFDLIGYDGGAALAVILTSQRSDITSLRTVAGNLDPNATAQINAGTTSAASLNPLDFAASVGHLPQRHFLGKKDMVTPPIVYNNFAQSVGINDCMNVTLVDNADHVNGWVEQWPVLKTMPLDCAATPQPVQFDPTPLDGDKYHAKKKHK